MPSRFLLSPPARRDGAIHHQDRRDQQLQGAATFLEPYKKGWELAQDEINKAGGVNGKKLETFRDDNANPGDAVRVAEELVAREKVALLSGTFLSTSVWRWAISPKQRKVLFIASEPLSDKVTWGNGNAYTYRLRASTYMQTTCWCPKPPN